MLDNAQAFLAALAANEDDHATRLVYADWLEERGEYEEAARQRQWKAAKAWLLYLLEKHYLDGEGGYAFNPSLQELCEQARAAIQEWNQQRSDREDSDREEVLINCGNNMGLSFAFNSEREGFWKNYAIFTGESVPDLAKRTYFACGC